MLNGSHYRNEDKKRKHLNIIYFFDGSKTKTLRLPLIPVKILLVVSWLCAVWLVVASFLLFFSANEQYLLYKKIHTFSDVIFQYQVKYDSVYERAYPTNPIKLADEPAKSSPPAAGQDNQAKAQDNSVEKIEASTAEVLPKENSSTSENENILNLLASKSLKVNQDEEASAINIENPILMRRDNRIELSITLHNKKTHRAKGMLSATAEWKDSEGQIKKIDSLDGKKSADGQGNSKTFNIKQYKREKFLFSLPNTIKDPVLTKIEIWVSDKNGEKNSIQILGDT